MSYYLECNPSPISSNKSSCETQIKIFGSFYLKINNENYDFYLNIYTNNINVNGSDLLYITPYKLTDFEIIQTFQIIYSSVFGENFLCCSLWS